jgi:hypothetical protein
MRFLMTATLTIVILGILTLTANQAIAQTTNVTGGFTANPSLALEQPLPHVK